MLSSVALGGATSSYQVYVDTSSQSAYGTVSAARYSSDSSQEIGCYEGPNTVGCYASDASGNYLSCVNAYYNPDGVPTYLPTVISGINAASYIYFVVDPNTGECGIVQIDNGSEYIH